MTCICPNYPLHLSRLCPDHGIVSEDVDFAAVHLGMLRLDGPEDKGGVMFDPNVQDPPHTWEPCPDCGAQGEQYGGSSRYECDGTCPGPSKKLATCPVSNCHGSIVEEVMERYHVYADGFISQEPIHEGETVGFRCTTCGCFTNDLRYWDIPKGSKQ